MCQDVREKPKSRKRKEEVSYSQLSMDKTCLVIQTLSYFFLLLFDFEAFNRVNKVILKNLPDLHSLVVT